MQLLSVGVTGTTAELKARLQDYCLQFVPAGYSIVIDETKKGCYTFLKCKITEGELSFPNIERLSGPLKLFVGKILADIILQKEESNIVRQIIDRKYYYFTNDEKNELYEDVISQLNNNSVLAAKFDCLSRREWLAFKIWEYFGSCHELILDGFIRFRLKEYRSRIRELIIKIADDYMTPCVRIVVVKF